MIYIYFNWDPLYARLNTDNKVVLNKVRNELKRAKTILNHLRNELKRPNTT